MRLFLKQKLLLFKINSAWIIVYLFDEREIYLNNNTFLLRNENCATFSIPNYILYVVLPKCIITHGEAISSTYFQIALTINHEENAKSWQKGKSWIGLKTISKITGFNVRKIGHAIKVLNQIGLIEQIEYGKLKMFKLKNNTIVNVNEVMKFIKYVEHQLLIDLPKSKIKICKEKFSLLNKKLNVFSPSHAKFLLKRTWIPDINNFRKYLIKAESIYKGSSLFFINLINQQLSFKNETKVSDNILMSEKERSLMIGCSQSTLNRYVTAYENANFIVREKQNGLFNIKLNFNKPNEENNISVVSDTVKKFVCPICNREMKTVRSFNLHLSKVQDAQHYLLNELRREKRTPDYDVTMMLYQQHKDTIDSLEGMSKEEYEMRKLMKPKEETKTSKENYMDIPCECKISCEECFKNWKKEYFDSCDRSRKAGFIKQFQIQEQQVEQKQVVKETSFENIPSTKKGPSPDSAPGLLKYFYELTGKKSPNWAKESKQIKNLLVRKENPLTPEQVRIVLRYMARKGHIDIRFLSNCVNEALLEHELLQQVDKEGTVPYLVKYFYNGFNMDINLQTFVKDVQKIQETINSGLNYEETKIIIDYMIETNCRILNFIGSKRNDALAKYRNSKKVVNHNSKDINNFYNNPSFFDQDFLVILRDELASGRTRLNKVDDKYKKEAERIARELFMERKFTNKFTSFEWLWRIGLPLDKEIYDLACKELNKQTYLDYVINSGKLKSDQLATYIQLKKKYETWLQKQHDFFRSNEIKLYS